MAAEGTREYDFTWTIRFVEVAFVVLLAAWVGTSLWTPTDLPRWLAVAGAVLIGIGITAYARRACRQVVRRATLDEHRLRVVTTTGDEHVIDLADLVVTGLANGGGADALARLDFPGGKLYLVQHPGSDLAERLVDAAEAGR
jgi:hypothetical protein